MAKDFNPEESEPLEQAPASKARSRLTRQLADIVCLPSSRVSPQERWMTADILDELLRDADNDLKAKVAARLAEQAEAPPVLLRRLATDVFEVAEPIVRDSTALTDFDMMEIARKCGRDHRIALARREHVSETVAAAVCVSADPDVLIALMRNPGARLAPQTVDFLLREATNKEALASHLIKRPELRPSQGFAVFWTVTHSLRKLILDRFASSRAILQEAAEDVFPLFAKENVDDSATEAALIYIDRRQRDRAAAERSPFRSLEGCIDAASIEGAHDLIREALASLSNIKRDLMDRIIDDFGGEPMAVLAKATGLSRVYLQRLIKLGDAETADVRLKHAEIVFATLSVDKAQTVLRYWNWVMARVRAE